MSGTDYFTYTNLQANTLARASDVNARIAAIQGGFAKLPLPDKLREDRVTAVVDAGTANALIVSLDTGPASYNFGLELTVKIANTNSGPATINVNGLGVKAVKRADGSALGAGDLVAGYVLKLIYDGTVFRLLGASETGIAAYAAAAVASATAAATSATSAATSASSAATSATSAAASATAAAASAASAAAAVSGYLPKAGGTMTGALVLAGAPTSALHASTKQYVDDAVFAAGAYTADGASITLSAGQFSLTTIANNRLFGNVSGGVAKPGALTGTQATALLDAFTLSLKGLVSPPGTATGKVLMDDGTWGLNINGNAATATKLATARNIAISGAVTGTATAFDGTANITIPITALDVGAATTGVLAVARGGTGVTTSTGSGSNVLSANPNLSGAVNIAGSLTLSGTLFGADIVASRGDGTGSLYLNGAGTRYLYYDGTNYQLAGAKLALGAVPGAGVSDGFAVNSAWVQTELANYSKALLTVTSISADRTLANGDNNSLLQCTGATPRTLTAGNINTGLSVLIAVTGSAAWTFSCAGGVYVAGATSTVTSTTIAAGSQCTAIHLGGGVWLLSGA